MRMLTKMVSILRRPSGLIISVLALNCCDQGGSPLNALTAVRALMTFIDFTLSNARRFYSSMGKPSAVKGLTTPKTKVRGNITNKALLAMLTLKYFLMALLGKNQLAIDLHVLAIDLHVFTSIGPKTQKGQI